MILQKIDQQRLHAFGRKRKLRFVRPDQAARQVKCRLDQHRFGEIVQRKARHVAESALATVTASAARFSDNPASAKVRSITILRAFSGPGRTSGIFATSLSE